MSSLRPDARARRILADAKSGEPPPEDPFEYALHHIYEPNPDVEVDEDVVTAYELTMGGEHHVMDALLLVNANDKDIGEALGLTPGVLAAYRHLFFDPKVFKHTFAIRHYVRTLPQDGSEELKSYELAFLEGPTALLNRYRIGDIPFVDPIDTVKRVMTELASRVREHRGRVLTTGMAQAALRAGKMATETAVTLHTLQPNKKGSASEELEIVLVAKELTVTPESAQIPLVELVREGPAPGVVPHD